MQHLIDTLDRWQCPVVATLTRPLYAQLRALKQRRLDQRLQLEGPRAEVKQLLADCVRRLEKKAGAAFGKPLLPVDGPASRLTKRELEQRKAELRAQRRQVERQA